MDKELAEPLFAEERKIKILELINNNDKVTVAQLCNDFNVSGATIRNDLRDLENSNLLRRTHGGAMNKLKTGLELGSKYKEDLNMKEKEKIAELALNLIEDGDTIILDSGTTLLELAKRLHEKRNLTVVINDIEIARTLEEISDIEIIFIGGYIRKKFHSTTGTWGVKMVSDLTVDKAFMGTNGLSVKKGATTHDLNCAEIKKAMIAIANKTIILCDSSKVGRNVFSQFADIQQIDTVITDSGVDEIQKNNLEASGLEVWVVEVKI